MFIFIIFLLIFSYLCLLEIYKCHIIMLQKFQNIIINNIIIKIINYLFRLKKALSRMPYRRIVRLVQNNLYLIKPLYYYKVTFFGIVEVVVEPSQGKNKTYYYHRRYRRVPTIDECRINDPLCKFEAQEQFKRDKYVKSFTGLKLLVYVNFFYSVEGSQK